MSIPEHLWQGRLGAWASAISFALGSETHGGFGKSVRAIKPSSVEVIVADDPVARLVDASTSCPVPPYMPLILPS